MNEDECLKLFGLRPSTEQVGAITKLLEEQTELETAAQGAGDTELMRLLCAQLFNTRAVAHSLRIWGAKSASMDADGAIDIQLLCGAGLPETQLFLRDSGELAALARIEKSVKSGAFDGFSVDDYAAFLDRYYSEDE
jgi:hypothetical protein